MQVQTAATVTQARFKRGLECRDDPGGPRPIAVSTHTCRFRVNKEDIENNQINMLQTFFRKWGLTCQKGITRTKYKQNKYMSTEKENLTE